MKKILLISLLAVIFVNLFGIWPFDSFESRMRKVETKRMNSKSKWTKQDTDSSLSLKKHNGDNKETFENSIKNGYLLTDIYFAGGDSPGIPGPALTGNTEIKIYGDKKTAEAIFYKFDQNFPVVKICEIDFFPLSQIVEKVKIEMQNKKVEGRGIGYIWSLLHGKKDTIEIYTKEKLTAEIDIKTGKVLYRFDEFLNEEFGYRSNIRISQSFIRDFNGTYLHIIKIYMDNEVLAEKIIKSDETYYKEEEYDRITILPPPKIRFVNPQN